MTLACRRDYAGDHEPECECCTLSGETDGLEDPCGAQNDSKRCERWAEKCDNSFGVRACIWCYERALRMQLTDRYEMHEINFFNRLSGSVQLLIGQKADNSDMSKSGELDWIICTARVSRVSGKV